MRDISLKNRRVHVQPIQNQPFTVVLRGIILKISLKLTGKHRLWNTIFTNSFRHTFRTAFLLFFTIFVIFIIFIFFLLFLLFFYFISELTFLLFFTIFVIFIIFIFFLLFLLFFYFISELTQTTPSEYLV